MEEIIKNKKRGEILAEKFASMKYGDAMSHQEIEEVINAVKDSSQYSTAISKARRILRDDHQMAIEPIRGYGYRIVDPDVHTNYALGHYKKARNSIRRGYKYLENAPISHMSQEALKAHRRVYDRAVVVNAAMEGLSTEMKLLSKKQHPFEVAIN